MAGMSACCLSGTLHTGTPAGREVTIAGLDTYVSEPQDGSKSKSIVIITDIFGWKLPNVRLLADTYAKAGFYVYIPDVLKGGALHIDLLQDIEPPLKERENLTVVQKTASTAKVGATLGPFLVTHREAVAKPIIDGFIREVKKIPGTNKVGAVGFCWGGRYAILAAHGGDGTGSVDAAYAAHPSLLSVPADIDPVSSPLSLAFGDHDSLVGNDQVAQIREILEKKSPAVQSEVKVYQDQVHGFALRGDISHEKDKKAMDDATEQAVNWLNAKLA